MPYAPPPHPSSVAQAEEGSEQLPPGVEPAPDSNPTAEVVRQVVPLPQPAAEPELHAPEISLQQVAAAVDTTGDPLHMLYNRIYHCRDMKHDASALLSCSCLVGQQQKIAGAMSCCAAWQASHHTTLSCLKSYAQYSMFWMQGHELRLLPPQPTAMSVRSPPTHHLGSASSSAPSRMTTSPRRKCLCQRTPPAPKTRHPLLHRA